MTTERAPARTEPGLSLPFFERLAPPPPTALLTSRIEQHTGPGDVVADLAGRGGWVARAALDRQRRAISIESSPLTRLLAEVVLRPPDVRHLDAAFQGMAASPRRESSLKVSLGDLFATRCATCGRTLVVDEIIWESGDGDAPPTPVERVYRCTVCRDQRGGGMLRHGPLDADDLARAVAEVGADEARAWVIDRFPVVDGAPDLVDELIALHTERQLVSLVAIIERIEGDLRAAPVLAALRLAFLHTLLPASRLAGTGSRPLALRIAGGHVRPSSGERFRERNPWLAFEEACRLVRGFVQRVEGTGPVQARLGEDLRSLGEGTASAVLAVASPSAIRTLRDGALVDGRVATGPRVRLVLGQPAIRPGLERLGTGYHGTAWVLGREAASLLPIDVLAQPSLRLPWSWHAVAIGRSLAAVEPSIARDGRVIQFVDGGAEAVAAAAIGGASAGYRVVMVRLADRDDDRTGVVELIPPGATLPPGPRTRANVVLDPIRGGPGDPDLVPGPGLFAPPERFDQRPFSATEAARVVTDVAVETLKARGEPARYERLFGEVLVGLDRSGQLRRLAAGWRRSGDEPAPSDSAGDTSLPDPAAFRTRPLAGANRSRDGGDGGSAVAARAGDAVADADPADPVERLLDLIRDEFGRATQHRLVELEPGRWWLGERSDRDAAAPPLADRVEWAVFSLLSTAGPMSEHAFFERVSTMFTGHDLADEALVRACLDSYRSPDSGPDRLAARDDLLVRSQEHTELVAALADAGHRAGMRVWISTREQGRRDPASGRPLGERLDTRERDAYLGGISRAADDLAEVDAMWYVRNKIALLFEVEWTAILSDALLRRHVRIGDDERIIRFLVIAPERTDLVRYKLERSPLLRQAMTDGGWNILKSSHLRTWLTAERPDLADLEPLLGLDPLVERSGEQMPLFSPPSDGPAVP